MDRDEFEQRLRSELAALSDEARSGVDDLCVIDAMADHPLVRRDDTPWMSGLGTDPSAAPSDGVPYTRGILWFSWPAFEHSALASAPEGISRLLRSTVFDHQATRLAWQELSKDDERFAAHAAFRRGEPLLDGWYRSGTVLAPLVWNVDLDLFVEVTLPKESWTRVADDELTLDVLGIQHDVRLHDSGSAESTLDEESDILTLEGAGLIDSDDLGSDYLDRENIDREHIEGDDDRGHDLSGDSKLADALVGDLHIVVSRY